MVAKLFKPNLTKFLCVSLALVIFSLPMLAEIALSQVQGAVIEAEAQADRDTSKMLWFAVGCLGNIVGIAIASFIEAKAPQTALLGKSPEYVASYSDAYSRRCKSIRTKYGLYGCGTSIVLYGLLYLVLFVLLVSEESHLGYYY
jgi:hypothetical protein